MGAALAVQILKGEGVGASSPVGIDDGLLQEVGVVVIHLYLQFLLGNGQVERSREPRVPSLFLLKPFVGYEGLSAGQKRDVLSQDMGRAIAFAR